MPYAEKTTVPVAKPAPRLRRCSPLLRASTGRPSITSSGTARVQFRLHDRICPVCDQAAARWGAPAAIASPAPNANAGALLLVIKAKLESVESADRDVRACVHESDCDAARSD